MWGNGAALAHRLSGRQVIAPLCEASAQFHGSTSDLQAVAKEAIGGPAYVILAAFNKSYLLRVGKGEERATTAAHMGAYRRW
jgi:hypothetical protein